MLDKNEVKKDLYKSKNMAKFSHYVSGNLYYNVELADGVYQFPIATIDKYIECETTMEGDDIDIETISLSSDLGTTVFNAEVKGSELNRWISKAIDKGEFTKVGVTISTDKNGKTVIEENGEVIGKQG